MAFNSGEMETAWRTATQSTTGNPPVTNITESEWVNLVQPSTLNYFRFGVTVGILWKWNRVTGAWDDVTASISSIVAAGAIIAVTVQAR
jgi:hypothetical protein